MKLLLDTHLILWALNDNPKLPDRIHISGSKLADLCRSMGYQMLPITDNM